MRVLVYGGRDFIDYNSLWTFLDKLHYKETITCIVSGMAKGADSWGYKWAEHNTVPVDKFPANWKKYQKKAGPIRNQQMINEGKIDYAVRCPGGIGTDDMSKRLFNNNIDILDLYETY